MWEENQENYGVLKAEWTLFQGGECDQHSQIYSFEVGVSGVKKYG